MYDSAQRKRTQQRQRQKGCFVYVPAEELKRAGFDEKPAYYRVTHARRGGIFVQFYKEP